MLDIEQLKIIRNTLNDLSSAVNDLIMGESRELLPEVAKLIDEYVKGHKDEIPERFGFGDVVVSDTGDKAIVISRNYDFDDEYGKYPYYDLLFDDMVVENEDYHKLTKTGENVKDKLNDLFKILND